MANIVKWRQCGTSWNEVGAHIEEHGILTSRGAVWNRSRVRRAFTAELYLQTVEAAGRSIENDPALAA